MPLFEFNCRKCKVTFEFLALPGRKDEKPVCPQCGGADVKKMLSSFRMGRSGKNPSAASSGSACGGCTARSCKSCR